jgi:DNA-binding transcriptional LysR family regulator
MPDMYNITFQQIETFLRITKYLNVSKAAEAMYISQPALSKTLQRFEEGLGLQLFMRGNKGVVLTTEGEYLYSKFEPLYDSVNAMIDAAHLLSGVPSKMIRFVQPATYDLSKSYDEIKKLIHDFGEENPNVLIVESLRDFKEMRQMIEFGNTDFFITQDFLLDGLQNISFKRVAEFKMYVMMSSAHPMAASNELDYTQLGDNIVYRVTAIEEQYDYKKTLDLCASLGFTPKKMEFLPNFQTLYHTILKNKGISICSQFDYIKSDPEFRYYPFPPGIEKNFISVVWHTDRTTPEMRAFIRLLPGEEFRSGSISEP